MKIFNKVFLVTVFILPFLNACEKDYYQSQVVITDSVSFSADIIPIFQTNCMGSSCHDNIKPILTPDKAYDELLFSPSGTQYVDTLNPSESYLYKRITTNMPPGGLMNQEEIGYILAWIEQGAQNN